MLNTGSTRADVATTEENRILLSSREQFINHGFSKVTTDEIAAELGMSKKTLYKHFASKEALMRAVMRLTMAEISSGAERIIDDDSLEYPQKLSALMAFFGKQIGKIFSRPLIQDLQKKAPHLWREIETFRKEQIFTKFANLIDQGVKQGYVRNDINRDIIVRTYFAAAQHIMNPETLSNLPLTAKEAFDAIIKTLFQGVLTEKARLNFEEP